MENSAKCKGKANLTKAKKQKFIHFVVLQQLGRMFAVQNKITSKCFGYLHFEFLWDQSFSFSASYEFLCANFFNSGYAHLID